MKQAGFQKLKFKANIQKLGEVLLIRLPIDQSKLLPSRGLVMVNGLLNSQSFRTVLEPDGVGGHWFELTPQLLNKLGVKLGSTITVELEVTDDWIDPEIPEDLKKALDDTPDASDLWATITPNARWDWIRWIRFTKNPETRAHRIEVMMSKMKAGSKRPCCFNRNICTIPEVAHNGQLLNT